MGLDRSPLEAGHPSDADLMAFAVGRLQEARIPVLELHLADCDRCSSIVSRSPHDKFVTLLRQSEVARPTITAARVDVPQAKTVAGEISTGDSRQPPAALRDHERFRVIRLLAVGGMGAVYLAEHRLLRTPMAIKTIRTDGAPDYKTIERFLQEAKTAAQLDHVNIARVFDAEQAGDMVLLAIEYVPGKTLAQVVAKRGPLPTIDACRYIYQAASGLAHAASRGVVHRDIKPHNLMVAFPHNTVKVLDFGLGRLVDEQRSRGRLTTGDDILGTPHFIAPEQIRDSRAADAHSDVYSLGCTLYFLLAGETPFRGNNPVELLEQHVRQPAPLIRSLRHDVPEEVARLLARMLAKDPRDRPGSADEVAQVLEPFCAARPSVTAAVSGVSSTASADTPSAEAIRTPAWKRVASSPVFFMPMLTILLTLLSLLIL